MAISRDRASQLLGIEQDPEIGNHGQEQDSHQVRALERSNVQKGVYGEVVRGTER